MTLRLPWLVAASTLLVLAGCGGQATPTATPSALPTTPASSPTMTTPTLQVTATTTTSSAAATTTTTTRRPTTARTPVAKPSTPAPSPGCSGNQSYLDADDKSFQGKSIQCTQERYWAVMRGPNQEWLIVAWNGEAWRLVQSIATVSDCVGLLAEDPDAPADEIRELMDGFCDEVE